MLPVLAIRHEAALQKGLRWEARIPAELPVIYADPERLAQARIFEPFYRGKTLRRSWQGLGLGLTIAHDLVAAHGGRIDLDSMPGLCSPSSKT